MTFAYPRLKATALDLIDDFSPLAILPRYGEDGGYSAKTRLDDIDITAPIRAVMIVRVNKMMGTALPAWRDVRPVDTAVPPQCRAYGSDLLLAVGCLDVYHHRPIAPKGAEEARMCLALKPDSDAVARCFELALTPPAPLQPAAASAPDTVPAPDAAPVPAPAPVPAWTVQVREQSLPSLYQLNEPAQLGYKHENGRSDPLLKAAVVADGPPLGFIKNWNWFVSTDLNIDLAAPGPQRANSKAFGGGAHDIFFDYLERDFAVDTTINLAEQIDSELHTRSTNVVLGNLLVIRGWADGAPFKAQTATWQIIPVLGLSYERLHKVEPGMPKGARGSVYGGVNLALWPGLLPHTQFTVKLQRFVDTDSDAGLDKRHLNYASFGAEYFLYDPKDPPAFTPRLALVREVGSDPLTATRDKSRTLVVFKFTLN